MTPGDAACCDWWPQQTYLPAKGTWFSYLDAAGDRIPPIRRMKRGSVGQTTCTSRWPFVHRVRRRAKGARRRRGIVCRRARYRVPRGDIEGSTSVAEFQTGQRPGNTDYSLVSSQLWPTAWPGSSAYCWLPGGCTRRPRTRALTPRRPVGETRQCAIDHDKWHSAHSLATCTVLGSLEDTSGCALGQPEVVDVAYGTTASSLTAALTSRSDCIRSVYALSPMNCRKLRGRSSEDLRRR